MSAAPLWTSGAMAEAMRAQVSGVVPVAVSGLSIDSRTIAVGEAYFAIKGDIHDGHDFVAATEREFDLILVDGFDAKSRVGKLDTLAFYQNCSARLSRYGVLVANFLNARRSLAQGIERMSEAFSGRAFAMPHCAAAARAFFRLALYSW